MLIFFNGICYIIKIQNVAVNIFKIAEQKFSNQIEFSNELIEDLRVIVKSTRAMIRTTQGALNNDDLKLAKDIEAYKQNIEDLIFKAKYKHIENIQYGKHPMEFDYLILNLFTDLSRTAEHCMNISAMILKKEQNKTLTEFVYAW